MTLSSSFNTFYAQNAQFICKFSRAFSPPLRLCNRKGIIASVWSHMPKGGISKVSIYQKRNISFFWCRNEWKLRWREFRNITVWMNKWERNVILVLAIHRFFTRRAGLKNDLNSRLSKEPLRCSTSFHFRIKNHWRKQF